MLKVENLRPFNWEGAIRGLRNPMNSWAKSDSTFDENGNFINIGENDLRLMKALFKAGTEHRKYLRQIFVSMDITAPLYWISELDTYKVGTVRNSCSFMHKGASRPFKISDFSTHDILVDETPTNVKTWKAIVDALNQLRKEYLHTRDNNIFQQIRCLLPSGYNLRFTITMNYENVFTIIKQRSGHRLDEWNEFVEVLKTLPYVQELLSVLDEKEIKQ